MSILTSRGERTESLADAFGVTTRMARVNLLPPEIIAARAFKKVQRGLVAAVLVVLLALVGVYLLQVQSKNQAADELATAQVTGRTLQAEQAKYADVPRVYQAIEGAQAARESAMSQDVEWYRYLTDISLAIPSNVWLTSLQVSLTGASTGAAPAPSAGSAAGPIDTSGVGSFNFQGVALEHTDVAAWLDMLGKEAGVADPYFSSSVKAKIGKKDVVNYSSTATVTSDALSHRFDRKAG